MKFQPNSTFLFILVGLVILFVIAQSVFFLMRAYRRGKSLGIQTAQMRKTILSTAVFTLAPAVPPMAHVVDFGIPPGMLKVYHARRDAIVEIDHFSNLAVLVLDPHPISLLESQTRSIIRVHFNARHRPLLAAPWQLTMLGMEVHRIATTGRAVKHVVALELLRLGQRQIGRAHV